MNKVTMERVAEKVLKAISDEGLTIKEAGKILGLSRPNYLSMIKKDTYYDKVPSKAWEVLMAWANSGAAKIKGFHANKNDQDHDPMVPDLENDQQGKKSEKDLFSDLAKANYGNPERPDKHIKKPLPPIVQEAMARKIQKDMANAPIVQDVILNVQVRFNLSIE